MTDFDKAIEQAKSEILPFESWEKNPGESGTAFAAFCVYRDLGAERNIRKAVDYALVRCGEKSASEKDEFEKNSGVRGKRYGVWRNWSTRFRWRERALDYDCYMEKLKQAELRKTIEAQGEMHKVVTGKMLEVVQKKLDLMDPAKLS